MSARREQVVGRRQAHAHFPADQIPVLAAAIANDIGTPVDEEKLATALSHDVIASLGAALSNG